MVRLFCCLSISLLVVFKTTLTYGQRAPLSAVVAPHKGHPAMVLNGKAVTPVMYALTDVPGGRWPWEEIPRHNLQTFCQANIHLIQADLFLDQIWMENGTISTDTTRKILQGIIDACPDATIFLRLHVNPPVWWQQKHPEENTVYADAEAKSYHGPGLHRLIQDDEKTPARYSLASELWKTEVSSHLILFLQALQYIPESAALAGIQVAGGVYGEWHYWGFLENEPDMSRSMFRYFRKWLKLKYQTDQALQKAWHKPSVNFENAEPPDVSERRSTRDGIFRDADLERKVIDYYEAQHDCVAEDIIDFCKIIKTNWPRPIITGSFYGYFYSVFGREVAGGHLAVMKILNSPYVDFLCGPHAYYPDPGSSPGDPYRSRSLINSMALHGKLWMDEMDIRPPLVPISDSNFTVSLRKSIATTRNNMLFTYSKGMGMWFYDFGPSGMDPGTRTRDHGSWGWWDEPSLMKDISAIKSIMDSNIESPYTNDADVLLVHDTKTFFYTASSKKENGFEHWVNNWLPVAIFRTGVVHDVIHIDDLELVNLDKYKVVVFVNDWIMSDRQIKFIREQVAKNKRHLIFIYAPAYSDGKKSDIRFIERITGMKTEKINSNFGEQKIQFLANLSGIKPPDAPNVIPRFIIVDKKVIPLAVYTQTGQTVMARKSFGETDSWYLAMPSADIGFWRYIFKEAGAHIYDEEGDIFYTGHGILSVHTLKGGERTILLKNGKKIHLDLPASSTTLLDPETGTALIN